MNIQFYAVYNTIIGIFPLFEIGIIIPPTPNPLRKIHDTELRIYKEWQSGILIYYKPVFVAEIDL